MNRHVLEGCTTAPFSSYLKAVGAFRILAQPKDSSARAHWKNERLVLETTMAKNEIMEFILDKYCPLPAVAPWSYSKYKKMCNHLAPLIESERFQIYKETIKGIDDGVIAEFCRACKIDTGEIDKAAKDRKTKPILLRLCRNMLPDEALPWLDAAFVLAGDSVKFAPILGTGGNDGNFDMPENFAKCLAILLDGKKRKESKTLLESALFGGTAALEKISTMGTIRRHGRAELRNGF